jgi:hypothetical protein
VTMSLGKASVEFFKSEAEKNHTSYQVMIRILLDLYALQFQQPGSSRTAGMRKERLPDAVRAAMRIQ